MDSKGECVGGCWLPVSRGGKSLLGDGGAFPLTATASIELSSIRSDSMASLVSDGRVGHSFGMHTEELCCVLAADGAR